jgi:2-keto-4-pentenoate hydratase
MTSARASASDDAVAHGIAGRFVRARRDAVALPEFPGVPPGDLASAYAIQDAAIALWPDRIVGWKVGRIPEAWRERLGEPRMIGPIFAAGLRHTRPGTEIVFGVFVGGFAAVEAEFVLRLALDAPTGKLDWTAAEAAELVDEMMLGVETAGSPLATINELGPPVVVSDFGNNSGLILGPSVPDWRRRAERELTCETFIEGRSLGQGSAAAVEPLEALAHALSNCARRGRPLLRGDLVSTGAATGIHQIRAGERARIVFPGYGEIECRAEPAQAPAA